MTVPSYLIVGAGYAGSATALELARRQPTARITLVEACGRFGPGLAYGAADPRHLLNVRTERMGAFADDPGGFLRWATQQAADPAEHELAPDSFAPRGRFGMYLTALLEAAPANIERVTGQVVRLSRDTAGLRATLADGRSFVAAHAILALGNPAPARPRWSSAFGERWINDPWHTAQKIPADAPVLLLGTGLTTIDQVLRLRAHGHRGTMLALSRRGLLPNLHRAPKPYPDFLADWPSHTGLAALTRRVRDEVAAAALRGIDWRIVVEGVRPALQRLWAGADLPTRRRFLRWLRPYWDVHRHRLPRVPAVHVSRLRRSGVLTIAGGRIRSVEPAGDGLVRLQVHGRDGSEWSRDVAWGINCTGPDHEYARSADPLVRQLLQDGMIQADPLGMGLVVTPQSAVVDAAGGVQGDLSAVGPPTRGTFWEITSVPDIRQQVAQLAARLAG